MATLKVKFAVYVQNNGDGSASARFFSDVKLAEQAAEKDDERFCEDIQEHEFEIDLATGTVISGIKTAIDTDEED